MRKLIIKSWLNQGLSVESLKLQKALRLSKNKVELLNTKHGIITYLNIGEN